MKNILIEIPSITQLGLYSDQIPLLNYTDLEIFYKTDIYINLRRNIYHNLSSFTNYTIRNGVGNYFVFCKNGYIYERYNFQSQWWVETAIKHLSLYGIVDTELPNGLYVVDIDSVHNADYPTDICLASYLLNFISTNDENFANHVRRLYGWRK